MYDAIVVGGRCAGSPTAMLLARKGYSVLVLERATFPSDTVSTHIVKRPGVERLERWGLLERVLETGCPPIRRFTSNQGDFSLTGTAPPVDGVPMLAPRRTVLDELLAEAAVEAGAELREGVAVRDLLTEGDRVVGVRAQSTGGAPEELRARVVIGADGNNSLVARRTGAPTHDDVPPQAFYHYAYWPGLPVDALEVHWRHHRFVLAIPTNDDLTCLVVGRPVGSLREFAADVESNYRDTLSIAPDLAAAVDERRPVGEYVGTSVPSYFRRPSGPGWILVGDAGLCTDPLNGHGISDAFRDAELAAGAVDEGLSGRRSLRTALADYERERDARKLATYEFAGRELTVYEHNWRGSRFEGWDDPPTRALRTALRADPDAASRWAGTIAFSVGLDEFYSSEFVTNATSSVV